MNLENFKKICQELNIPEKVYTIPYDIRVQKYIDITQYDWEIDNPGWSFDISSIETDEAEWVQVYVRVNNLYQWKWYNIILDESPVDLHLESHEELYNEFMRLEKLASGMKNKFSLSRKQKVEASDKALTKFFLDNIDTVYDNNTVKTFEEFYTDQNVYTITMYLREDWDIWVDIKPKDNDECVTGFIIDTKDYQYAKEHKDKTELDKLTVSITQFAMETTYQEIESLEDK